jgi:GntR family transcriptional regulator of vanillate catabolism
MSAPGGIPSQSIKAVLALRDLILRGTLAPGERLSELVLVERLGVSRTPVRAALARLAEEGLVDPIASGGYAVRAFVEADIVDAIELRGTLEGLAARFAAERGAGEALLARMRDCVAASERIVGQPALSAADFSDYIAENERFHTLVLDAAQSPTLARQLERVVALPFASPNGFVMAQAALPQANAILTVAQEQHRCVVEAIAQRQGARAEALMREHARLALRNLQLALREGTLAHIRGGALIQLRRRA